MSGRASARTVREAVAVFEDWSSLETAVDELLEAGFAKEDISLLAGHDTVVAKLGHMYERVEELEDDPNVPRTAFVSSKAIGRREDMVIGSLTVLPALLAAGVVVASAGAVAAAIAGTAVAGAAIGTALARWMDQRHATWLQEQMDRGGILLWVRTPDTAAERRALGILTGHSVHDVHIHEIPRD
jgi:outer membrane lipoprotein SlyB